MLAWVVGFVVLALALRGGLLGDPARWARVWQRLPQLGWGFLDNVVMSIIGMVLATILGSLLGSLLLARRAWLRWPATFVMNFLRNSPWLVLLFATLYLLPFRLQWGGWSVEFPPIAKAIIGLTLPTAANFAEIIRGGVQSIHSGQWESARSLGYTTTQILRRVVLPQALRRILPGWMNLYALLMIATALATVTGTQEVLTVLRTVLATEPTGAIAYFYMAVLAMFFTYCYPIAWIARRLERASKGEAL
ncbi:MAG TPA: amino acid ABC transporter permease [Stellaceae bacterium]|nr:amino acid ABC transporter permease [Stellaceae bacterium]